MSKLIAWAVLNLFAASMAFAQIPTPGRLAASYCAAKAVSEDGKALVGAARDAFMKKCEADANAATAACAAKALDKNGKPLAGGAKVSFMKKCEADAKAGK